MKINDPEQDSDSFQRHEEWIERLAAKAYKYHEIWDEFDKMEGYEKDVNAKTNHL